MGAHNVCLIFDGSISKQAVVDLVDQQKDIDRENQYDMDPQDIPYAGDWTTIPKIKFPTSQVFEDYDAAEEYCLDKSQKWEYAVAVKFKDEDDDGKICWMVQGWAVS